MKFKRFSFIVAMIISVWMIGCLFVGCVEPVTVTLDKETASVFVSESTRLKASTSRDLLEDEALTWTSNNESVATVNNGTVKGVADGTAVITVSIGESSASCTVTVKTKRTMTISQETATINLDDEVKTVALTATCSDGGEVVWTSSDNSIATVENGVVTGLDVGSVTITAARDEAKATCVITIIQPSRPYEMPKGNNAAVAGDPGVWYYFTKGADAERHAFTSNPMYENGAATLAFDFVDQDMEYYFRYQPTYAVGTQFNITLTITVNVAGSVRIQQKDYVLNEGENVISDLPVQTVQDGMPINIRPLIYGGTAEEPANIVITISNVIITPVV